MRQNTDLLKLLVGVFEQAFMTNFLIPSYRLEILRNTEYFKELKIPTQPVQILYSSP